MQHPRQLFDGIGLLQQLKTVTAVLRQHVAVAAGQHHRQVVMPAADFLRQFDAGHAGHHHVGKHHVETAGIAVQLLERVGGVADQRGAVTEPGQRVGGKLSDLDIVLDHQHPDALTIDRRRLFRRHLLRPSLAGHARQIQREGTALAQFAGDDHFAAGLLCKTEHLRQAEPGALADLLGGEEGFKNTPEPVLRDSDAGILDGNGDIAIGVLRGRGRPRHFGGLAHRDREFALAVHGVARVDRHVDDERSRTDRRRR